MSQAGRLRLCIAHVDIPVKQDWGKSAFELRTVRHRTYISIEILVPSLPQTTHNFTQKHPSLKLDRIPNHRKFVHRLK